MASHRPEFLRLIAFRSQLYGMRRFLAVILFLALIAPPAIAAFAWYLTESKAEFLRRNYLEEHDEQLGLYWNHAEEWGSRLIRVRTYPVQAHYLVGVPPPAGKRGFPASYARGALLHTFSDATIDSNIAIVRLYGWPLPTLFTLETVGSDGEPYEIRMWPMPRYQRTTTFMERSVPANVLLTGWIANSVVFCAMPLLIGTVRFLVLALWRDRRNQCMACGYDLRANTSAVCSECGWSRKRE